MYKEHSMKANERICIYIYIWVCVRLSLCDPTDMSAEPTRKAAVVMAALF